MNIIKMSNKIKKISKSSFQTPTGETIKRYDLRLRFPIRITIPIENAITLFIRIKKMISKKSPSVNYDFFNPRSKNLMFEIYISTTDQKKIEDLINQLAMEKKKNLTNPIVIGKRCAKDTSENDLIKIKFVISKYFAMSIGNFHNPENKCIELEIYDIVVYKINKSTYSVQIHNASTINFTDRNLDHMKIDSQRKNPITKSTFQLNELKQGYRSYIQSLKPDPISKDIQLVI